MQPRRQTPTARGPNAPCLYAVTGMSDAQSPGLDGGAGERKCEWDGCTTACASEQALYEHLLDAHDVPSNQRAGKFICKWAHCSITPQKAPTPRRNHLISASRRL